MDRSRAVRLAGLCVMTALVLAGLSAAPAAAHKHPQAPFVEEPAVVYLQTAVDASIDRTQKVGGNLVTTTAPRTFVLATGSGFTVNGDGTIVTVNAAVPTTVRPGDLTAINQVLSRDYGITLSPSVFSPGTRGVRACTQDHSTCVKLNDPVTRVFPFVFPALKQGLTASVLKPGGADNDVAVIKVGGNGNMPAVNLASSVSNLAAFTVLGFQSLPNGQAPPAQVQGHFKPAGSGTIDKADLPKLRSGLRPELRGGPLVDDSGRVVGLLSGSSIATGSAAGLEMKDLAALRAALQAAGASASQGPVDTAFQSAASFFQARHYTPAVPGFRQVLQLYPGHALAQQELQVASAKAGGPEDLHGKEDMAGGVDTSESGSQRPLGLWLGAGGGVLLLAALVVGFLLLRRRAGRQPPAATEGVPAIMARPRPPVSGSAPAPAPGSPGGPTSDPGSGSGRRSVPGALSRLAQRPLRQATPPRDGSLPPAPAAAPASATGGSQGPRPVSVAPAVPGTGPGVGTGVTRAEGKAQSAFCTRCGGPLAPRHRFCGFCGAAVSPSQ
jgi:hypothetical protein